MTKTKQRTVSEEIFDSPKHALEQFAALFPGAVKDGAVDFSVLKEELGHPKEVGTEKYGLTWTGKQNAKKLAQEDVLGRTLRYVPEESKNSDTTQNLYIEGDNLEVLKLLRQNYYAAIKMIYIDPPYNTGNDFVYRDNFTKNEMESELEEGNISEDGERLVRNQRSTNRFHANWLSMMYPRLRIARDLLTEDGVIFISIDDNEVANLRMLCDEIFGENNFVAQFTWKSKLGKINTTTTISTTHEYIVCYSKNASATSFKMVEKEGDGRKENLRQWGQADRREDRPSMFYPITIDGIEVYPIKDDGTQGRWRVGMEKAKELFNEGRLELVKKEDRYNIYRIFDPGLSSTPYDTLLLDQIGTTAKGATTLQNLGLSRCFDYSKPFELMKFFSLLATLPSDTILDFFSGSGTTAQAVMQLNAEDGGNRKFIMVQIPEKTDEKSEAYKSGYKTIAEIGKERIRRAGDKIKADLIEKQKKDGKTLLDAEEQVDSESLDIGFKVFKTDDTMIRWTHAAINDDKTLFNEAMLSDKEKLDFMPYFTDVDVAYEILLRQHDIPLSAKMEQLTQIGKRTWCFADSYVVCLEEKITPKLVEKLAAIESTPFKYIFRDSAFGDDIALKDETMRRLDVNVKKNSGEKKKTYTVEFL